MASQSPTNISLLRESLSAPLLRKACPSSSSSSSSSKNATAATAATNDINATDDISELSDFIDYLSTELFTSLPQPLQTINYTLLQETGPQLLDLTRYPQYNTLLPTTCLDSLLTYNLVTNIDAASHLLLSVLDDYLAAATAPPPIWKNTRTLECEICERGVPLSYHHLIPRSTHAKVLKRKWHAKERLNSVAWLCRACHCTVHRCASNEELARRWYTVELLMAREDVQRWAAYVGKQRWKKGVVGGGGVRGSVV